jgi:hypothetical protein
MISPEKLRLQHFTGRSLNLIASAFGAGDARVLLSDRVTVPISVALDTRTIVLDPQRCGPKDLILASHLIEKNRVNRKRFEDANDEDSDRIEDDQLTAIARREWLRKSLQGIRKAYPGVSQLFGLMQGSAQKHQLRVTRNRIDFIDPPKRTDEGSPVSTQSIRSHVVPPNEYDRPGRGGSVAFEAIPQLEIHGHENDYDHLIYQIESGQIPVQHFDGLEEVPFVRIPIRYVLSETNPLMEQIEESFKDKENEHGVQGLMQCIMRKSIVRQETSHRGKYELSGTHLDSTRLVEAAIQRRRGLETKLFRRLSSNTEPVFDPDQHLTMISIDMNDLHWNQREDRDEEHFGFSGHSATVRFVSQLVRAWEKLGTDLVIQGFADRIVELSNGQLVCLHFVMNFKEFHEPFTPQVWHRLGELIARPPQFPGTVTGFHPLSQQDAARVFDEVVREQDHSYRTWVWWARRGMNRSFDRFDSTEFLMREADWLDREMKLLTKRLDGEFQFDAGVFLPARLIEHGRPGEFLQNSMIGYR